MQTQPVADQPAAVVKPKQVDRKIYPVDHMCQLLDGIVANISRQLGSAATVASLTGTLTPAQGASQGSNAGTVAGIAEARGAPTNLGEYLQRLILPPNFDPSQAQNGKLSLEQCQHILAVCSRLLHAMMNFDPAAFNKVQPNMSDTMDNDPSIPQTYLKHVVAGMSLVMNSLPPAEARIIKAVVGSAIDKIQQLEPANLGPSVVASKPGNKMDYALGFVFPPNPQSPPTTDDQRRRRDPSAGTNK